MGRVALAPSDERVPTGTKVAIMFIAIAINAVLYLVPNHVVLQPAIELPWTRVDRAVPFIPWTLWVYFTDYLLVGSAFLQSRTWGEVRTFARAYFALLLTGALVHLAWPTAFPRESFPVSGDGFTAEVFALFRQLDMPTSCMPSMHVAGSFLAAFSLWRRRPSLALLFTGWACLVAVSTLTVKQHYAVDVGAGVVMATLFWAAFYWWPVARPHQRSGSTLASMS
jgi:membrane-associated phospholipid phosphatase